MFWCTNYATNMGHRIIIMKRMKTVIASVRFVQLVESLLDRNHVLCVRVICTTSIQYVMRVKQTLLHICRTITNTIEIFWTTFVYKNFVYKNRKIWYNRNRKGNGAKNAG